MAQVTIIPPWQAYLQQIRMGVNHFWDQHRRHTYGRVQSVRVSEDMIQRITQLASLDGVTSLTPGECFVLHAVCYLYEVGWQEPHALKITVAERYIQSGNVIRETYQGRRPSFNLGLADLDLLTVDLIATLCSAFGVTSWESYLPERMLMGNQEVARPRFLMLLLHLADLLTISRANSRFLKTLPRFDATDIATARIALAPYVPHITVENHEITPWLRLHPVDQPLKPYVNEMLLEPVYSTLEEYHHLLRNFGLHLEVIEAATDLNTIDGLLHPEPISDSCNALVDILLSFPLPSNGRRITTRVISDEDELQEGRFHIGQRLNEHYEIIEVLDPTSHSQVLKARDLKLQRDVAIKIAVFSEAIDKHLEQQLQQNLIREARILADLDHPNIGKVYSTIPHPPAIVIQWINGISLQRMIDDGVSLSTREILLLGIVIAEALDYAHSRGVVHRDVKPANIIVVDKHQPVLVDFDISHADIVDTISLRDDGSFRYLGSPSYSAPEQFRNPEVVGPAADLFALGVVLYQLVTGYHPFPYGNLPENYEGGQLPTPQQHHMQFELYCLMRELLSVLADMRPSARHLASRLREIEQFIISGDGHRSSATLDRGKLRNILIEKFSEDELQLLCADVEELRKRDGVQEQVNLEVVGGNTKATKVLNLIQFLERRGHLHYLTSVITQTRPGLI